MESGAPQKSEFDDENMVANWWLLGVRKNGKILIGLAKVTFASMTCLVQFYFREFQITLTTPNEDPMNWAPSINYSSSKERNVPPNMHAYPEIRIRK